MSEKCPACQYEASGMVIGGVAHTCLLPTPAQRLAELEERLRALTSLWRDRQGRWGEGSRALCQQAEKELRALLGEKA